MRIASWNIAGGHTVRSARQFDYDESENQAYFINQLAKLNLDIVCLQEAHGNSDYSLAEEIGRKLHLPYVFNIPTCPSHIDSRYMLCNAILSKRPFISSHSVLLPQPSFPLFLNGKRVAAYDRYLVMVQFPHFQVATLHVEPLSILGSSYHSGKGLQFAYEIDKLLTSSFQEAFILTADLYRESPSLTMPTFMKRFKLADALPPDVHYSRR